MRSLAWLALALAPLSLAPAAAFGQKLPFDSAALLRIQRISDPQISPDGKTVAFGVAMPDVGENRSVHSIWSVPVEGGSPRKLAEPADRPRWSPDGKQIYYVSASGGSSQIWKMNPDGSQPSQVTKLASEADGETVSPDGKFLIITSSVYPECAADSACNSKLAEAEKNNKVKAKVINSLLFRHWTQWQGKTRTHILSISLDSGKAVDLTPGNRDVPPFSLGGPDDYAISPDSREVCFSMNTDEVPANGTNADLFVIAIEGGEAKKITVNVGADSSPQYSPDGKFVAFRSQAHGGYESDKWRLALLER